MVKNQRDPWESEHHPDSQTNSTVGTQDRLFLLLDLRHPDRPRQDQGATEPGPQEDHIPVGCFLDGCELHWVSWSHSRTRRAISRRVKVSAQEEADRSGEQQWQLSPSG